MFYHVYTVSLIYHDGELRAMHNASSCAGYSTSTLSGLVGAKCANGKSLGPLVRARPHV